MNVLFLTPDAVGGTLLQRLLTVYMQLNNFDRPVINVGHVELGLETYHCTKFNQQILRSRRESDEKLFQSLSEIQKLLSEVDHYKLIKLPYYNILGRQDTLSQQIPFYQYLNDNFFIISCRRKNLFEHSLSWCLNKITRRLNVFTPQEKIQTFARFYLDPVSIDPLSVEQSLHSYKQYIQWCDTNFRIASYYEYETHLPQIEDYIFGLPFFRSRGTLTSWQDAFGQSVDDWNRCHFYLSDIGSVHPSQIALTSWLNQTKSGGEELLDTAGQQIEQWWRKFYAEYQKVRDSSWPDLHGPADWECLPNTVKNECRHLHGITYWLDCIYIQRNASVGIYTAAAQPALQASISDLEIEKFLPEQHKNFLQGNISNYRMAKTALADMVNLGILPNEIPIKKNTLEEKIRMIKNIDQCLDTYNQWISRNPGLAAPMTPQDLAHQITMEQKFWSISAPSIEINQPRPCLSRL